MSKIIGEMNRFMHNKAFNRVLSSHIVFAKRSAMNRLDFDLGKQMKFFNDNKKFQKTLELFDKNKKNSIQAFSSLTVTQALKACAHLGDIEFGKAIHRLVPSRIKDDSYILASLIHLYSKFQELFSL